MYEQNENDYAYPNNYLMINPETADYQNNNYVKINPPLIDLNPVIENIIGNVKNWWEDLKANSQQLSVDNYQKYPTIETGFQPLQLNTSIEPQPAQLEYVNQNSIIHEELAEKTKEIQNLKIEDEKNKERITKLEKQVKELKKEKKLLVWMKRAINDSQYERII